MYAQYYNFSEKPFNPNPDPKFLYLTPSRREALASMIYGINERKGFISITGEVGTGKTTLIYTLLNHLNEKVKPVIIQHTMITFEQLLKAILLKLGVPLGDFRSKDEALKMASLLEEQGAIYVSPKLRDAEYRI